MEAGYEETMKAGGADEGLWLDDDDGCNYRDLGELDMVVNMRMNYGDIRE